MTHVLIFIGIVLTGAGVVYRDYLDEAMGVWLGWQMQGSQSDIVGRVEHTHEKVELKRAGKHYFLSTKPGEQLFHLDTVSTLSQGQARIVLQDDFALDIAENTTIVVQNQQTSLGDVIDLRVQKGQVGVTGLNGNKKLRISGKNTSLSVGQRDQVKLNVNDDQPPELEILSGKDVVYRPQDFKVKNFRNPSVNQEAFSLSIQEEEEQVHETKHKQGAPSIKKIRLDSRDIRRVLARLLPRIQSCYERQLGKSLEAPSFNVSMRVKGSTGRVSNVDLPGGDVEPEIRTCVLFYLKRATFPRFVAADQKITLPILLK